MGTPCLAHDVLRECFGSLDPSGFCPGPEDRDARVAELIGDAGDERRLRPDDYEVRVQRPGEIQQALAILCVDGMTASQLRDAGVAGRGVELLEVRRLFQFPGEGMLSSA